jgi:hypothetical protein
MKKKNVLRSLRAPRSLSVIGVLGCVLCSQPVFGQQTHLLVITGVTVVEERELWDMPALFLALVGFIAAEWGYRRMRGLA